MTLGVAQPVSTIFSQPLVGSVLQPDMAVPKYLRDVLETKFYSLPPFPALDFLSRCPSICPASHFEGCFDYAFLKATMPFRDSVALAVRSTDHLEGSGSVHVFYHLRLWCLSSPFHPGFLFKICVKGASCAAQANLRLAVASLCLLYAWITGTSLEVQHLSLDDGCNMLTQARLGWYRTVC